MRIKVLVSLLLSSSLNASAVFANKCNGVPKTCGRATPEKRSETKPLLMYSASFQLQPQKPHSFEVLKQMIRTWTAKVARREGFHSDIPASFYTGVRLSDAESGVEIETKKSKDAFILELSHFNTSRENPQSKDRWKVKIRATNTSFQISNEISLCPHSDFSARRRQIGMIPGIVRDLFADPRWSISSGNTPMRPWPFVLTADEIPEFVAMLTDRDRKVPILYLSQFAQGATTLNPTELAHNYAGMLIVVVESEPRMDFALSKQAGLELRYFPNNGWARIYFPLSGAYRTPRYRAYGPASNDREISGLKHVISSDVFGAAEVVKSDP